MACSCGNKSGAAKAKSYVVTAPNGAKTTYRTEVEAAAAVRRIGGSYKAQ